MDIIFNYYQAILRFPKAPRIPACRTTLRDARPSPASPIPLGMMLRHRG